ncbi:hypothetical protein EYC98_18265 [Halieaceae bacterium IMCC14734]|uniref:PNPLA domain-containing protein n=1 Tax=Candidatus Litorirhabdus singularis TaxID=2518993 RepID=A0ABT3TKF9_9GAMM|nr:patatin-like phospholipase family protein [Candidatus Litorirhabdus singularis]MCX2982811.1 hypothetical protein [Candidatus Litorirhabdus singularis]
MTKRILTIDGGGIRGVFSAAIIEQMEIANGGKPACELFDCFVGTSAGSLLAAGLAKGISAGELKQHFIALGEGLSISMNAAAKDDGAGDKGAAGPRKRREASSAMLEDVLKKLLGENTRPADLKKRFAVVTKNMDLNKVVFFGNFPKDQVEQPSFWSGQVDESSEPVWKIVLRSAALPPLFAPQGDYLDGGISPFANPTYAAYVGVQRRLGWNPYREPLKFYSVGTGYHEGGAGSNIGELDDERLYASMVSAMMQDVNFLQHQIMKRQAAEGDIWYKRYNISFTREGFEKLGIEKIPSKEEFAQLASTASPRVKELAEYGSYVGKKMLAEGNDFLAGAPLQDRRSNVYKIPDEQRFLNIAPVSAVP